MKKSKVKRTTINQKTSTEMFYDANDEEILLVNEDEGKMVHECVKKKTKESFLSMFTNRKSNNGSVIIQCLNMLFFLIPIFTLIGLNVAEFPIVSTVRNDI